MNETPQLTPKDKEILNDLESDFNSAGSSDSQSAGNAANVVPVVIPEFLPTELVRILVAGKNGLIVQTICKNVRENTREAIKEIYKPDDREVGLYKKALEKNIWHYYPSLAKWFLENPGSDYAELILLESIRGISVVNLIKQGKREEEEK